MLGEGELTRALKVTASKFSGSAKAKIEKAGGQAYRLPIDDFRFMMGRPPPRAVPGQTGNLNRRSKIVILSMLSAFTNSMKIPELRSRIFYTLALLFVSRVGAHIPLPGLDPAAAAATSSPRR